MEVYGKVLSDGLQGLRKDDALVDFTIQVDGAKLRVHKVILASMSGYFRAMLMRKMTESQLSGVKLEGFCYPAVSSIINYMYTGKLELAANTVEELLRCAVYLQVQPIITMCSEYMIKHLNLSNCFYTLSLFRAYSLKNEVSKAENYITEKIDESTTLTKLYEMPFAEFICVVEFWCKSEKQLYEEAILWLSKDFKNRIRHEDQILSYVHFALMTPAQLQEIKKKFKSLKFKGSWRKLVDGAVSYQMLPMYQKVSAFSVQSKVKAQPTPMCFNYRKLPGFSYGTDFGGECYSLDNNCDWQSHQEAAPIFKSGAAATVVVNNFLVVCEDSIANQIWHIFDPRTMSWGEMAKLRTPRERFALAEHGGYLYVMGGLVVDSEKKKLRTDSIEKYDFKTNTWSPNPTSMLLKLSFHSACTLNDFIYITGGSSDQGEFKRMDWYDVPNNIWICGPELNIVPPSSLHALQVGTEKELVGVRSDQCFYYSPSTSKWNRVDMRPCVEIDNGRLCEVTYSSNAIVLGAGNSMFFLNYDYQEHGNSDDSDDNDEDHDYYGYGRRRRRCFYDQPDPTSGGCAVWNISGWSKTQIQADTLDGFPIYGDTHSAFGAMLSLPPNTKK